MKDTGCPEVNVIAPVPKQYVAPGNWAMEREKYADGSVKLGVALPGAFIVRAGWLLQSKTAVPDVPCAMLPGAPVSVVQVDETTGAAGLKTGMDGIV